MSTNWLLDNLQTNGYRLTPTRKKICQKIDHLEGIFCAGQIIKQIKTDKVAIYRNLDILTKLNLIQPVINISGQQFFEKNNETNHHHHIVCTKCLKTECVKCTEPKIKNTKFKNLTHSLIFTGLCQTCAK